MKPYIHTIFIWILSLSLTGLPVITQAQDMAGLNHSEKNTAMKMNVSDGTANDMPCHSEVAQMDIVPANIKAAHAMHASDTASKSSKHDCCCGDDCQCHTNMGCQSAHYPAVSAILLQSVLLTSFPQNSQRVIESVIPYNSHDDDVEIIPVIV